MFPLREANVLEESHPGVPDLNDDAPTPHSATFRAGYAAIMGRPNTGKSTLLNALLGQSLAAVSHKVQTTRLVVRGILTGSDYQLVLEDTPGLLDPHSRLDQAMLRMARYAAESADLVAVMLPPWRAAAEVSVRLFEEIPGRSPAVAVINKIDLVAKPELLPVIAELASIPRVAHVVPVSATQRDGLDRLVEVMSALLPASPPLHPPEMMTDQPERFFVAEVLREHIMAMFHEEVPYASAVEVEEFVERGEGKDYIRALIWVERDTQRAILLGKGGRSLKALGIRARSGLEHLLGREVYLDLWVKVRPKWRERDTDLVRLGFTPTVNR